MQLYKSRYQCQKSNEAKVRDSSKSGTNVKNKKNKDQVKLT